MRKLALAAATLAAFLLPLLTSPADAKPRDDRGDRGGVSSSRIDWD